MSLPSGARLGPYEILGSLGAGGMGEVYKARDSRLEREVAIKVLPAEAVGNPERRQRFLQEARAASSLRHPGVTHIYEVGEEAGVHYIAMEYVEGCTLARKLAGGRPLPVREISEIGAQVADALDAAHSHGVVHRDIKAENVMITPRGQVKVLDFGLAKVVSNRDGTDTGETQTAVITRPGFLMGTLPYMSPEQALGREVDARSDIFSFGVVLYQMAAGRLPFSAPSQTELLQRITQAQPEAVARFNYEAPPELERIIRKCLEKDRDLRYQSARELVLDLRSLHRDSGTVPMAPAGSRTRRSPILWAALLGVVALAAGLYWLLRGAANDSIAVLPFVNAARDASLEYLSDGLTEELINTLAQAPKLKVMARATVFSYKGRQVDPQRVGRELGVSAVLMGRVAQRGNNVAVQVDLVNARDGSQLWGQQYSRTAADVQAIQEEIARDTAERLRLKLGGERAKRRAAEPEAYSLYLRGRQAISELSAERVRKSLAFFEQAIARDPNYAPAYAGLADSYSYLALMELARPDDVMPKAKAAALRALQIDPLVGEAHTSLGIVKSVYEWDWAGAGRDFDRGLQLNAGNGYVLHWHAHYQEFLGRWDQALREMRKALEIDPLNGMIGGDIGLDLYYNRHYDDAVRSLRTTLQLAPEDPMARIAISLALERLGRRAESLAELEKANVLPELDSYTAGTAAGIYCRAGKPERARLLLARLTEAAKTRYVAALGPAMIHTALGDTAEGLRYLERACEEHAAELPFLTADPALDGARSDPRFVRLMEKTGLPKAAWAPRR